MALEVEQGLRIKESDHRSAELGQESEGRQQPLALGSRPGRSFSLSQGAEPLALNLLGQPILSPSPWGLIQGLFGTVNCLLPKENMKGLAALKSGHKLQSQCCQFSQLPGGQSQEPSEDSTPTPSVCVTSVRGGLSALDGRHLPQRSLTCTVTGAWADFLRSCPHRADGCSLLCLPGQGLAAQGPLLPKGLTQGW